MIRIDLCGCYLGNGNGRYRFRCGSRQQGTRLGLVGETK